MGRGMRLALWLPSGKQLGEVGGCHLLSTNPGRRQSIDFESQRCKTSLFQTLNRTRKLEDRPRTFCAALPQAAGGWFRKASLYAEPCGEILSYELAPEARRLSR